jgi:KipI family sensor histidine kinase inhibitor
VNLRPAGERALLVEVGELETVHRLYAALRRRDLSWVAELVPGYETLLVVASPGQAELLDALAAELPGLELPRTEAQAGKRDDPPPGEPVETGPGRRVEAPAGEPVGTRAGEPVEVPVRYDGEDLPEVARLTGLDAEEVVRRHTAPTYTVAFLGFSPGFPYLVGLDKALVVPRRDTPRTQIPAGSVGLAGDQTGIYPTASPGGWQLIGRTDLALFDPERDPPALLGPGGRLRFTAVRS